MEIKIKSLKFDADKKLLEFVEKKVAKLEKFHEDAESVDVTLSLEKDAKGVKLQVRVPGSELVIEREAKTFEDAVEAAADAMKEKMTRIREKQTEK